MVTVEPDDEIVCVVRDVGKLLAEERMGFRFSRFSGSHAHRRRSGQVYRIARRYYASEVCICSSIRYVRV